jgi:hypothetical protein
VSNRRWVAAVTAALIAALALAAPGGAAEAAEPATATASGAAPIDEHSPPPQSASWLRACSLRRRLCVHAAPGTEGRFVLAVLDSADRAWETVTGALAAPAPDPAADGIWHVYVPTDKQLADLPYALDALSGGGTAVLEGRDPVARFDRGSSFALVDGRTPRGCPLDLALARAVARGSIWRTAPATDEGSARAEAEAVALLATPCEGHAGDAATFQGHPERTLVDPFDPSFDRGAALWFDWLDTRFGSSPGALIEGLWALSPTRTTASGRWPRRPTGFDVLRVSLRDRLFTGSTFDDVVTRFGVDRASMRPPASVGWHIEWPARPRRLLPPAPVAPLGASYVLVDTAGRPAGSKLLLEAQWEDYARMRWVAVKLDDAGHPAGEMALGSVDKGTHATLTIEDLEGTSAVMIVGVDVGDTEGPFDPTAGEWEPHGWMLTLSEP